MLLPDPLERPTLKVDEVALVYGIGRRAAYEECRRFLDTDGAEGIPAIRIGHRIVCPTAAIRKQLAIDPTTPPADEPAPLRIVRAS